MDYIFQLANVLAMLDKDDHLDAVLLRSLQFRSEPLVVLHNVVAQFLEIGFAIYRQHRIVEPLVVPHPQFTANHLDLLTLKLGKDLLDGLRFLARIS